MKLTPELVAELSFILDQHSHSIDDIVDQLGMTSRETREHCANYNKLCKIVGKELKELNVESANYGE